MNNKRGSTVMDPWMYGYDEENRFTIQQFDQAKPFSSFLPGIAGLRGIPMWAFYVNRGQGICSFGIRDKNTPIVEFSPANIAYKQVGTSGFRTFIKCDGEVYEPFAPRVHTDPIERKMTIEANELLIHEIDPIRGFEVRVRYFTMPGESYAGLVRRVEVINLREDDREIELVDGLPEILPYGVENAAYKEVGNLARSWMEVFNLENQVPFFKVRASMEDEAEVREINGGHFYLSFSDDEKLLTPIVDATVLFGKDLSLHHPERLIEASVDDLLQTKQYPVNKVPCGFSALSRNVIGNGSIHLTTIIGHVSDEDKINRKRSSIVSQSFIDQKEHEARALVDEITKSVETKTAYPIFDHYCRQNYLDNVLRGGLPLVLGHEDDELIYHVYSRKHGDLERDYNFFKIAPEYYSQGNGNFRDMNQNRRNDLYFNPKVGSFNVRMFMSFIQADGYNPLVVEGCQFEMDEQTRASVIQELNGFDQNELLHLLSKPYTPGQLMSFLDDQQTSLERSIEDVFAWILRKSTQRFEASFGEGFWTDHWTYNMDLIEQYLSIYPDQREAFLFDDHRYRFFDSPVRIVPRKEKYQETTRGIRQYHAVQVDSEKLERLQIELNDTNWLRTEFGKGPIYETNLIGKLISLAGNKLSLLDPQGLGIEMEANKPGWNDALNGLPGLIGSGMSETFELKRLLTFLYKGVKEAATPVSIPVEIVQFLERLHESIRIWENGELTGIEYWDQVATYREQYRESIRFGISGEETALDISSLVSILESFLSKVEDGIVRSKELTDGLYPTYFYYEATDYKIEQDGSVSVKAWDRHDLPSFLEGPARAIKVNGDAEETDEMVKKSALYDEAIHMYKTSVSLEGQSNEIGRIKAFTPGWLERESVFLHMSYKYVLSFLQSGAYERFYEEMKQALVPFMDAAQYGRSTLENSSFIASSVNPDPTVHGQGFVARLSGSTAEFLSMWKYMMMGPGPFFFEEDQLHLRFSPILEGDLFTQNGEVSFTFLSTTNVTYINPKRLSTFGPQAATIQRINIVYKDGQEERIAGNEIVGQHATSIRNGKAERILVYLDE